MKLTKIKRNGEGQMGNYQLKEETFCIREYEKLPAFSSFLPGLAGVTGIPIWVFYTNRGQGINSFGIHNKGNAIMEFNPANTAYENTALKGFRTFIRKDGVCYEPFGAFDKAALRTMHIEKNRLVIEEENRDFGIRMRITYFVLPKESIGALVRRVEITNISGEECALEGLDGLPKIIPYGVTNSLYKEMSNLFRSYSEIKNTENRIPFYATRSSGEDTAEVAEGAKAGYFYCSVADGILSEVLCDSEVIFDYDSSLVKPLVFEEKGLEGVRSQKQCFANKVPCGFTPFAVTLAAEETYTFTTYIGYAGTISQLNETAKKFCEPGYADRKEAEAVAIAKELVTDVATSTADKVFDNYIEQCYLDNFLRGGYPYVFGEKRDAVVHLFSRKHGDPERDYNFFSIAGEYFSQGNGNFRDVCQNRRSDVFFHPEIGDFNVWSFFNYVQMDGYNPLEIRPCTFVLLPEKKEAAVALVKARVKGDTTPVERLLEEKFTPGQICVVLAENGLVAEDEEALVADILGLCSEQLEANFAEGYWSDHWDYLMDLIENYLLIFPDKKKELLLGRTDYRFYDSPGLVRPRRETYVLSKGKVRQYGALNHSKEKESREGFTAGDTNWLKDTSGSMVTTTLLGKMLTLAVNKFLLLDQEGMGIEMDGGRPGWNDAMNGLPGLFGSGMPETMELARLLGFLCDCFADGEVTGEVVLPKELAELMERLAGILAEKDSLRQFEYWDKAATLRETFREEIKFTVSGETKKVPAEAIGDLLKACLEVIKAGIEKAWKLGNGIMPTYLTYEAVAYEERKNEDGSAYITPYGLPGVSVSEFVCHIVPPFLEGPAKMMANVPGKVAEKKGMYKQVKESDIYDKKLKMYKTSGSIESVSMEHGRVRAFTPGWLERESVFLHMEYKYLLGLLRAGLTEEYYEAMKDALIPFQDPAVYGRSTLENSSFLASSANPDEKVHGRGFVARLSGSTTEMISMWITMFLGEGGFKLQNGELNFVLEPKLADWLFDENGEAAFALMSRCKVVYKNPAKKNTFGTNGVKVSEMKLFFADGEEVLVQGNVLGAGQAVNLRNGNIVQIEAVCR